MCDRGEKLLYYIELEYFYKMNEADASSKQQRNEQRIKYNDDLCWCD